MVNKAGKQHAHKPQCSILSSFSLTVCHLNQVFALYLISPSLERNCVPFGFHPIFQLGTCVHRDLNVSLLTLFDTASLQIKTDVHRAPLSKRPQTYIGHLDKIVFTKLREELYLTCVCFLYEYTVWEARTSWAASAVTSGPGKFLGPGFESSRFSEASRFSETSRSAEALRSSVTLQSFEASESRGDGLCDREGG